MSATDYLNCLGCRNREAQVDHLQRELGMVLDVLDEIADCHPATVKGLQYIADEARREALKGEAGRPQS